MHRLCGGASKNRTCDLIDAENFAHLIEVDRAQGSFVDPRLGKITVAEWWERWWPTVTNLRPISRVRDECSFRVHVLPTFGSMPLARVDRTSLREWVARLSDPVDGPGLAPASVVKAVQVFNKVMRAAFEDRLIMANPVERLPVPRIEREETRFLTPEELARLADTIDSRYRAFVLLAGYGGLRIGELFALRWQHVDMLRRQVKVTETLTELPALSFGPPKTRASLRTITLPVFVTDELSRVPTSPPDPSDLVFTSPEGRPDRPTLFRPRVWKPAVDEAGLAPLRVHDLRHTAVSLWIAAGANPKQIAARAGHTSVSVVLDRYGHLLPQHDDLLMEALEELHVRAR